MTQGFLGTWGSCLGPTDLLQNLRRLAMMSFASMPDASDQTPWQQRTREGVGARSSEKGLFRDGEGSGTGKGEERRA